MSTHTANYLRRLYKLQHVTVTDMQAINYREVNMHRNTTVYDMQDRQCTSTV